MTWLRVVVLALIAVLGSFTTSRAQENVEEIRLEPFMAPKLTAPSFWNDDLLRLPKSSLLDSLCQRHYAPGELVINYGGLKGALLSRALAYHRRYFFKTLDACYQGGLYSDTDVTRLTEDFAWAEQDSKYGRWWERNFFESMVPEKGGAGPSVVWQDGRELSIFTLGGLTLTNTGRLTFGRTEVYVQKTEVVADSIKSVVTGIVRQEKLAFSDYVKMTIRPRVSIRASLNPEDIISKVELAANIRVHYNPKKPPIAVISISAETEPFNKRAAVKFGAVIVW